MYRIRRGPQNAVNLFFIIVLSRYESHSCFKQKYVLINLPSNELKWNPTTMLEAGLL